MPSNEELDAILSEARVPVSDVSREEIEDSARRIEEEYQREE